MFKRLSGPTGEIADQQTRRADDTPDKITRSAILIHSGPDGDDTTLASSDGDITFNEARIRRVVTRHNAMISKLAIQYGGFDRMPVGAYPPILDQHSDDSNDRIRGRLTGLLRFEKRSVPKVGENVACAVCDITFLGRDTVDKVNDGRIYHLSVGIDESSDTLGETSTVIEPAAPGAMLLKSRKNLNQRKLKVSKTKLARLKKLSGELAELNKKSSAQRDVARLAKAKADVNAKLTKLMSDKKMTPAEAKKIDVARLAKLDKDSLETIMHVYEAREALVKPGQQGSTSAASFSDVGTKSAEDREVRKMKLAARASMEKSGVKFKRLAADDEATDEADVKKLAAGDDIGQTNLEGEPAESAGNAADADADVQQKEEMMQQIEQNAVQIARVASMVDEIMTELQGDDDGEVASEDVADDDKAELEKGDDDKADDEKESDDKKDDDKKDLSKDDKDKGEKE